VKSYSKEILGPTKKRGRTKDLKKNKMPIKNKTLKFACAGTTGYYMAKLVFLFQTASIFKKKKKKRQTII
jgi:hypothetical protein